MLCWPFQRVTEVCKCQQYKAVRHHSLGQEPLVLLFFPGLLPAADGLGDVVSHLLRQTGVDMATDCKNDASWALLPPHRWPVFGQ